MKTSTIYIIMAFILLFVGFTGVIFKPTPAPYFIETALILILAMHYVNASRIIELQEKLEK